MASGTTRQPRSAWQSLRRELVRTVTRTPKKMLAKLTGQSWPPSALDDIIDPQISGTPLFAKIQEIVSSDPGIHNILEIGASSGDGSTEAFVTGLGRRPGAIYTFEISKARFARLAERYSGHAQLRPINESSIAVADFASPDEIETFYHRTKSNLNNTPLVEVLGWLKTDLDYIRTHRIPENGIARLKTAAGIQTFDCVLIDGSEFTGRKELELVYGSTYILLDDIHLFKNHANHRRLLNDSNYKLIEIDNECRNGYSVFKAVNKAA